MAPIARSHIKTPLGLMIAEASDKGITQLDFIDHESPEAFGRSCWLDQLHVELGEYFAKEREIFTLPLDLRGSDFQCQAWQILQRIPYGSTISYAQQAALLGRPTATRAVAHANSRNPIAILIPCHRVIASNGSLGGYSGGLWRKAYLLDLERHQGI
ncbi:MAG: methylated-DNA--[protein]-cysteine S-methyltransferase [Campylobacterales bacterium]